MDGPTEEGYCFSVLGEPGESTPSYYNSCGIWPGSTSIVNTNLMGTRYEVLLCMGDTKNKDNK